MEEPVTSIKLVPIKLQPNDYDEEDSTTPMLKKNNQIAPVEEGGEVEGEEAPNSPFNDKFREIVGSLTADNEMDDEDPEADFTIIQAAAEGEISVIKERVQKMKKEEKPVGVELSLAGKDGFTPLHMAARYNRKNVVNFLIDNDVDKDRVGKEGLTPLHLATK